MAIVTHVPSRTFLDGLRANALSLAVAGMFLGFAGTSAAAQNSPAAAPASGYAQPPLPAASIPAPGSAGAGADTNTNTKPNANAEKPATGAAPGLKRSSARTNRAATPRVRGPKPPHVSGLVGRFTVPQPVLPPDKDRDYFTGTRHVDREAPPLHHHVYAVTRGGIYGQPYFPGCTACASPYFVGDPGVNTINENCKPSHPLTRIPNTIFHPLKPVGFYYAGGCNVPIYDTNVWSIGPGFFPYPFKQDHNNGG